VDTTAVVQAKNGIIKGLSKRSLNVKGLNNPSGSFHIGLKRAFDLWPPDLVSRIKESRKKEAEKEHKALLAQLYMEKMKVENSSGDDKAKVSPLSSFSHQCLPPLKLLWILKEIENVNDAISQLNSTYPKLEDPGPVFDCVVFHDGENWRAVIDIEETGKLENYPAMTDYGQYFNIPIWLQLLKTKNYKNPKPRNSNSEASERR